MSFVSHIARVLRGHRNAHYTPNPFHLASFHHGIHTNSHSICPKWRPPPYQLTHSETHIHIQSRCKLRFATLRWNTKHSNMIRAQQSFIIKDEERAPRGELLITEFCPHILPKKLTLDRNGRCTSWPPRAARPVSRQTPGICTEASRSISFCCF